VVKGAEHRVVLLSFDASRDELLFSDVKGRNPFKDIRVRRAVYHAIDIDSIIAKVLRGQATPTGSHVSPLVDGYLPELDKRLGYDPTAARALLKEAGYADGFEVALDCVNVTFRAAVCQAISGASWNPRFVSAVAELSVFSEANASDHQLFRVRVVAGYRSVGDVEQRHSHVRRRG